MGVFSALRPLCAAEGVADMHVSAWITVGKIARLPPPNAYAASRDQGRPSATGSSTKGDPFQRQETRPENSKEGHRQGIHKPKEQHLN